MHHLIATMLSTPQTGAAQVASAVEAMVTAARANGGELPAPAEYRLIVVCDDCGHEQYPFAINAVIEVGNDGPELVSYYVGSSGDFCDNCDSSQVAMVGWDFAEFLVPDEL